MPFLRPTFRGILQLPRESNGGSIAACTPVCCCRDRNSADRRGVLWCPLRSFGCKAPGESPHKSSARGTGSYRHVPRRGRARHARLAHGAMEGRALARHLHRGEASRRRAFADRAERKYRGRIRRPAWRAALFLVRRSRFARRGHLAGDARARRRLAPTARRSRATSWCSAESRRGRSREEASGRCAMPGIATRRISIRRGSRNCSTRRSTKSRRGARCMTCCGTSRATCSSTPWVCARTRRAKSFSRTAPTFLISCAPISPSRWDCRSAIRNARAATAARRRNARSGGTSRTRSPLPRRPGG